MKSFLLLSLILLFAFWSHAQAPNKAQVEQLKQMAERMKGMSPEQIMKQQDSIMKMVKRMQGIRDSISTDVLTQTAKKVANGDQLLIKHHYDTGYTKVTFFYTYTATTRSTKAYSDLYFSCGGTNNKAPKIYEANGHFIVGTSSVSQGADTKDLDTMASRINRNKPYMDPATAQKNIDIARQVSFSSMVVNDNGLKPSVSYSAHGKGECGSGSTNIEGLPTHESFSFEFDPVTNLSTIGLGANFKVLNTGEIWCPYVENSSEKYITGLGFSGGTDPAKAKMVGQKQITNTDPNAVYLNVRKSGEGVSISYQRSKSFVDNGGQNDIKESLSAFIGDENRMYEAIIRPVEAGKFRYDRWLPSGPKTNGSNDKKGDDSLQFYIEIRNTKDSTKLYPGSFTVNWMLDDVTKYPGFCNNYPAYSKNPNVDPDLKFDSLLVNNTSFDASSITDHSANSKTALGNNAFAHIICMDYGAYGKLRAVITMDDGSIINALSPYDKNAEYLTIPLDMNNNKIADAWEKKEGVFEKNYAANWDEDELPKDLGKPEERGDGYTLLEEYRGFSANKKFFRSSANTMDLMVLDLIGGRSKDGIEMYRGVTQVIVHDDFKLEEFGRGNQDVNVEGIDHDKCLNFNFTPETHSVDQHGIVIIKSDEKVSYAQAVSKNGANGKQLDIGTPKNYKYLKITPGFDPGPDGWNVVQGNISADTNSVNGDPEGKAKIISDSYSHTIAHEMLHCSNVKHHGDEDLPDCLLIAGRDIPNGINLNGMQVLVNRLYLIISNKLYVASTAGLVFWENGKVFSDRLVPPDGLKMWVARPGGQHSGFEDCIMRYRAARGYLTKDDVLYILDSQVGNNKDLAGIYLCTSKTGTGVNDKNFSPRPRYGDATEGDCKHQFCINDKYH